MRHRFAATVLLVDAEDPDVYLVPSTEWRKASPPLTDRPNVGKRSEPEYGVSLARSSLPALQRCAVERDVRERAFSLTGSRSEAKVLVQEVGWHNQVTLWLEQRYQGD